MDFFKKIAGFSVVSTNTKATDQKTDTTTTPVTPTTTPPLFDGSRFSTSDTIPFSDRYGNAAAGATPNSDAPTYSAKEIEKLSSIRDPKQRAEWERKLAKVTDPEQRAALDETLAKVVDTVNRPTPSATEMALIARMPAIGHLEQELPGITDPEVHGLVEQAISSLRRS